MALHCFSLKKKISRFETRAFSHGSRSNTVGKNRTVYLLSLELRQSSVEYGGMWKPRARRNHLVLPRCQYRRLVLLPPLQTHREASSIYSHTGARAMRELRMPSYPASTCTRIYAGVCTRRRARAPAQRHESVGCALASAVGKRWPQKLRKLFRGFVYRYVCVCAAYIFHKEFFRVSRCYFLASMYKRMYICGCNNLKFAYSIILDDTVRTNLVFLQ